MRGVERKIRALHDFSLRTYYEEHFLIKDEVKVVRFKNDQTFKALLEFGHFVIAKKDEKEVRAIPVLLPEVDENSLVAVEDGHIVSSMELVNEDVENAKDSLHAIENRHVLPPMELIDNDNSIDNSVDVDKIDHENET